MENPFRKRASENVPDVEGFLALVSHEPVDFCLHGYGQNELYGRLVLLFGTPGSGKTTLGRAMEYPTLTYLHREIDRSDLKALRSTLLDVGALDDAGRPRLLACRIAMDAEYRGIWELPYTPAIKNGLLLSLLQSRAILAWVRMLTADGYTEDRIRISTKEGSAAAIRAIGGATVDDLLRHAEAIEDAIYRLVHSLRPAPQESLTGIAIDPYLPFEVLSSFELDAPDQSHDTTALVPMVIIDDAHELHREQYEAIYRWFLRRDHKIARWIMSRFDAISPTEAVEFTQEKRDETAPGTSKGRDYIAIPLTNHVGEQRKRERDRFRSTARSISARYLSQMPVFARKSLTRLDALLTSSETKINASDLRALQQHVTQTQQTLRITQDRRASLEALVDEYMKSVGVESPDLAAAVLRILMHRYAKRTPQQSLFGEHEDVDPNRPITVDSTVLEAARIHLLHEYDRPFYFGFDVLADAGAGNVEQFLSLSSHLVEQIESKIVRNHPNKILDATLQHKVLRKAVNESWDAWDFPQSRLVKQMVERIAQEAIAISRAPNAPLGPGANAFGILQSEFDKIPGQHKALAQLLHYAHAYNVVSVVPHYSCKRQDWCLLELGGTPTIKFGLTFKRGGFVEGSVAKLKTFVGELDQ